MSESIFVRVQRVVSAGVGSAVETVERASSTGLMRDAMREADRAIDRLVTEREAAEARARNAEARVAAIRRELAKLDEQARFAVGKQRDDLAEVAVTRQVELEDQVAQLEASRSEALSDAERLDGVAAGLRVRRQQMKEELAAFRSAESAAAAVDDVAMPIDLRMARKVSRAEEAFERAMEEAGGATGRARTDDPDAVADITAMQKQEAVAARLAALKGGTPRKAGGKAARD
ncbi:PspA/IM30 family protein [Sphingomonas sp.]|jgi:phage shock protein A|uniref:PspA/IM30 family protein n=1 Tax=Sphingomonas sp. TaxID=28214 RepID=UPI002D7E165D|nr:PspA/IM30 family protein [Sphingomonas sp.]HEU0044743.1 PspA/IM30 family protein [Sphingomonas sp.]